MTLPYSKSELEFHRTQNISEGENMTNLSTARDNNLDYFRSTALIWVLFIHSLFWLGIVSHENVYKSFLLFEMPLFFLITGASNSFSKNNNLINFYQKRLFRILIPYWVYSLFCIFIIELTVVFLNQPSQLSYFEWVFPRMQQWSNLYFLNSHLWFITIYLLMILIFPFYQKYYSFFSKKDDSINTFVKYLPLILSMILLYYLDHNYISEAWNQLSLSNYLKYFLFYSFWIYLGIFYHEYKNKKSSDIKILLLMITFGLLTYFLIHTDNNYHMNMQTNKFPPNFAFLTMNITAVCILFLLRRFILKIVTLNIFTFLYKTFANYGYTIYLYQPFCFYAAKILFIKLNIESFLYTHKLIGVLSYFFVVLLLSFIPAYLFGRIETLSSNLFKYKTSKHSS